MGHCATRLATFANPNRTTARSIGIGDQGTHPFAMEINVTAVEKHLRGARDVLQADTTAQAAAKALFLKQIFI